MKREGRRSTGQISLTDTNACGRISRGWTTKKVIPIDDAVLKAEQLFYLGSSSLDQSIAILTAPGREWKCTIYASPFGASSSDGEQAGVAMCYAPKPVLNWRLRSVNCMANGSSGFQFTPHWPPP